MTEVLRALRDGSLKVEERLKVACAVARNENLGLPGGKITFLAKWTSEEICSAYNKRNRSPPTNEVCLHLWLFLATLLESQQLIRDERQQRGRESKTNIVPISIHLAQAMSIVLSSQAAEDCTEPVLSCLGCILRLPPPLPSIFYKFEVLVTLLMPMLVLAGKVLDSGLEDGEKERGLVGVQKEALETSLSLLLDHFTYLQGTQGNQKKVFTTVCDQILAPVITLRQSLLVTNDQGALREKLDSLLQSLFSKDHLAEYSSILSHHHSAVTSGHRSTLSYTRQLFSRLHQLLSEARGDQNLSQGSNRRNNQSVSSQHRVTLQAVLSIIPTLFRRFLRNNSEQQKLSKEMEFNFFLKLLNILGFSISLQPAPSERLNSESTLQQKRTCDVTVRKKARVEDRVEEDKEEEEEGEVEEGKEGEEGKEEEEEEGVEEGEVEEEEEEEEEEEQQKEEEEEEQQKEEEKCGDNLGKGHNVRDVQRAEEVAEDGTAMEVEERADEKETEIDWEVLIVRLQATKKEECAEEDRRFEVPFLKVLVACLQLLRIHNVYQAIRDLNSRQYECLRSLCVELVKSINYSNLTTMAECLIEVLQLNHKLVEPLLPGLLLLATSTSDAMVRMDSLVQKCIGIYSKLHQLGVFVSKMFSALEKMAMSTNLSSSPSPALSKSSEDWFCRHVQELPAGQSLSLLEQLSHSIQSIFLEKLPSLGIVGLAEKQQRSKKRRHSERKTGRVPSSEVNPSHFVAALSRGVDLSSLVLLNTPVSLWTSEGMYRERATLALLAVQRDVCVPLMNAARDIPALCTAALSAAHNLQSLLFCIRDTMPDPPPNNTSQDISYSLPVRSDVMRLEWSEEWGLPLPTLWGSANIGESLTPTSKYFMKAVSIHQLRFERDLCASDDITQLLDFIFEAVETNDHIWSGQPLDVNDRNFPTAVWHLALSSLPLFHNDCLPVHLKNVASFLYTALLRASTLRTSSSGGGRREGGETAESVASDFLHSVGFQDVRNLHESLLDHCFEQAALALPKSADVLKDSEQCCSVQLLNSSEKLTEVIEHGLQLVSGPETPVKGRNSVSKLVQHLSVCLEVMKVIPMRFMFRELLQRCVLSLTASHITLVHSICMRDASRGLPDQKELLAQLQELQLVLAWVLRSLVHCDRVGKKKTKLQPLPFPQLITWVYNATRCCGNHLLVCEFSQLWASILLLSEGALECTLIRGVHPTGFVGQLVDDVSTVVASTEETTPAETKTLSIFQLTVAMICKTYSDLKPSQRAGSSLCGPISQLMLETTTHLSRLRKKAPERVRLYPQLVSSFYLLFRTHPPSDVTKHTKSLKVVRFLTDIFCSDDSLHSAVCGSPSILCAVLDVLGLAATAQPQEDSDTATHLTVPNSWSKSVTLMKFFINKNSEMAEEYLIGGMSRKTFYGSHRASVVSSVDGILPHLSGVMTRLMTAADREQIMSMFQLLNGESCDSVAAALAVCHSWNIALGAKLQPESQRELRKWHTKILLQCESLAVQHRGDAPVIIMSLSITTRLVALPARVGLDSRLVQMSLHQTAVIVDLSAVGRQRCMLVLKAVGQLLFTVLKNHSSTASSCPGPVIIAINKLVRAVLDQCAMKRETEGEGEGEGDGVESGATVVGLVSRIFDHLAGRQEFTRYVSCVTSSYVAAVVQNPPTKSVKLALLPGVSALLRQCSQEDAAFIQASLGPTARTHFQTVLEEFAKQKRFL